MSAAEDVKNPDGEKPMPSSEEEDAVVKKKYGGIMPKKPPLISKDHERAYFDSADWALGKQGVEKPKGPLEALRPKLQFCWYLSTPARIPNNDLAASLCRFTIYHLCVNGGLAGNEEMPTQQQTRYRKSPYAPSDGEATRMAAIDPIPQKSLMPIDAGSERLYKQTGSLCYTRTDLEEIRDDEDGRVMKS
ncbi:hypothetical protein Cgig2_003271 [Carnegiea gigantea]|uniref:cAMP-regulated phosphoprotein 19-related protein n=1 Tax=Carnegiea gigantea TaxID=171969 RepID=A0A9Q1GRK9_9CARY|nr:hypothetical protein Cgig2_003271 [Carnegiea gigantea]